jgi:hypothetical protein
VRQTLNAPPAKATFLASRVHQKSELGKKKGPPIFVSGLYPVPPELTSTRGDTPVGTLQN